MRKSGRVARNLMRRLHVAGRLMANGAGGMMARRCVVTVRQGSVREVHAAIGMPSKAHAAKVPTPEAHATKMHPAGAHSPKVRPTKVHSTEMSEPATSKVTAEARLCRASPQTERAEADRD
jgi:hypothetical protein